MILFKTTGNFNKTERMLKKSLGKNYQQILHRYGQMGVDELRKATPRDSGETANSWYYDIIQNDSYMSVVWKNSHVERGVNIALILQYGHGTRNGGYVKGRDYINPALRPVFDALADSAWKEVSSI